MTVRTVAVKFSADVQGAVANVARFGKSVKDAADAGATAIQKNKSELDNISNGFLGVGATAAVGLGLAVKTFAEFDKQMSAVAASTGESTGNLKLLREAALDAGAQTKFSATEAAKGIEELSKAGIATADILGGGLTGALDLAAAGNLEVGRAAEIAATAMVQFKQSGSQVPHIADLLAAAAGKAQGDVSDMAMALKQSGLVANQFGLSVEETTGTLAAFASAGLLGSDAGTSFKTMLLALANPSKESAKAMRDLGIAAYDAQGQFIGIAPLAEQLKQRLAGLSQEQRNAALATIFGTDAIRAASVLYDQGADGITDWTTKVNDQGFAAEQAAKRTDNLAGDIERLGGALDTALIKSGGGANDVLRGLAQGADAMLTGFAELPDAVTGTATAMVAVVAVTGLVGGGMIKAATAVAGLRAGFLAMSTTARTLTISMGAIGVALAAAAVVYGVFAKRNEEAKQKADDLRSTLDQQTGSVTGNTRAYVANELAQSGLADKAKALGLNLATVTEAALGNQGALDGLVRQLDAVIERETVHAQGANRSATMVTAEGRAAQALRNELIETNVALTDAQKKQQQVAESTGQNTTAQQTAAAAHKEAAAATAAQTTAVEDLISAMLKMPGMVLSLRDAQRGSSEAFDKATAAIKENGRGLDINSKAGEKAREAARNNNAALDSLASANNKLTESLAKNGASQGVMQKHLDTSRVRLIAVARQMGMSKGQAEAYAKSVLAIPDAALTTVKNTAPAAKKDVQDYNAWLTGIPKAKSTSFTANTGGAQSNVNSLATSIRNLPSSKTVTIYQRLLGTVDLSKGVRVQADGSAPMGPLPSQATIKTGQGRGVYQWAEGETQREAFIPYAPQKRLRSTQILATVADDFGYQLVKSFANGGITAGGRLVDLNMLLRALTAQFNPVAGINLAGANKGRLVADVEFKSAIAQFKKVQAAAIQSIRMVGARDRSVDKQKADITQMGTDRTASEKAIRAREADQLRALRANPKAKQAQIDALADKQAEARVERDKRYQKALAAAKAELKKREDELTKAKNRSKLADDALTKSQQKVKAAQDRVAEAIKAQQDAIGALVAKQEEAKQLAESIAQQQLQGTGIAGLFQDSLSPSGLLFDLQQKGTDAAKFGKQLAALKAKGLAPGLLDQIRAEGATAGSELAAAILSAGGSYIAQLNAAQANLEKQANLIGAGAATDKYGVIIPGQMNMAPIGKIPQGGVQKAGITIMQTNHVTDPDIIAQRTAAAVAWAGSS